MVATFQTPHRHPTRPIILKAGLTPPELTMTVSHLPTSPSKRPGTAKPPLPTQPTPSKPGSQPQPALSASTRLRNKATATTTTSHVVSPPKPPTQPMSTQQTPYTNTTTVLLQYLPNSQISLIDLSWSQITVPSSIPARSWPLRLIHDSTAYTTSLSTETLCSTPSDFRSCILNPAFCPAEDDYGLVMTSLRFFGLEKEELVKTIVAYMQSGRFNSAAHNGGIYTFERSVKLLSLASRNAMVRVVELVLMEMEREFLGYPEQGTEPTDLTVERLDTISRVYDPRVWKWISAWIIAIFRTPKGQRTEAKSAVQECMHMQGDCGEGSSILQRIIAEWFKENPNPMRSKREGELSRLRAMKPKRARNEGSVGRSPSVMSIASTAATQFSGTQLETPTPGRLGGDRVRELQNSTSPTPKPRSKPGTEGACEGEEQRAENGEGEEYSDDEEGEIESEGEGEDQDGKKSRRGRKKRKAPVIHHVLLNHMPL